VHWRESIAGERRGRWHRSLAVVLFLWLPVAAHAEESETEAPGETKSPTSGQERGGYFSLSLTGGELDAPRQTPTTDLDLFSGLGLSFAGGYRRGYLRLEGELHLHQAERGFTGDTVTFHALMLNVYGEFPFAKRRMAFFVGAGFGRADVDVDIDTCIDLQGCPAQAVVDAGSTVWASQWTIGLGWSPRPRNQLFVGYRHFRTDSLALTDSIGRGFVDDHVEMPQALIGDTWRFGTGTQR